MVLDSVDVTSGGPVNYSLIGLWEGLILLRRCGGCITHNALLLSCGPSGEEVVADGGGHREVVIVGGDLLMGQLEEVVAEVELLHGSVVEAE